MLKLRKKPKVLKLEFENNSSVVSSSTHTSHKTCCSEDEINPHWHYDTWEFNFLTKRVKKKVNKTGVDNFFELREDRQKPSIPRLDLSAASQDLISPRNKEPPARKMTLQAQDSVFFYRSRKKADPGALGSDKEILIHSFSHSCKGFKNPDTDIQIYNFSHSARLPSRDPEKPFLNTFSRHGKRDKSKRLKNFTSSSHKPKIYKTTSYIRHRKNGKTN